METLEIDLNNKTEIETIDISNKPIQRLPAGLRTVGRLLADNTNLRILSSNITITKELQICGTYIKKLPNGLSLQTLCADSLEELPIDIKVNILVLRKSKIKYLPKNLEVDFLDLNDSKEIRELPKGLVVKGNLDITNTNIEQLPKDLIVGGFLIWKGKSLKLNNIIANNISKYCRVQNINLYLNDSYIAPQWMGEVVSKEDFTAIRTQIEYPETPKSALRTIVSKQPNFFDIYDFMFVYHDDSKIDLHIKKNERG